MKDKFEAFIKENRKALDTDEPNADFIWEAVHSGLKEKRLSKRLVLWKVAAAILAFLTVGQAAYLMLNQNTPSEIDSPMTEIGEPTTSGFTSLDQAYMKEISRLESEVQQKNVNPAEYASFFQELEYVENIKQDFNGDIPLANDKERIAEMLADTYEKKILLLERLLQQIEREERAKQEFKEL
jgi:hypothetical protein